MATNPFTLLKNDHATIAGIFTLMKATTTGAEKTREKLFIRLKFALESHAKIEEDIFYPVLKKVEGDAKLTEEAVHDHDRIRELIAKTESIPYSSEEWSSSTKELEEEVSHHVIEEENGIFEAMKDSLDEETLERLGVQIAEAQKERNAGR